ncbi:MAG: hypothetical protein ACTTIC_02905 [Helicobacteraceae bacterium]
MGGAIQNSNWFYGDRSDGLREGIAIIGYALHFSFCDIKQMRLSEFLAYVELAKEFAKAAARIF